MGAWGSGSFDNDDALDWLHNDFKEKPTLATIRHALRVVVDFDDDDYLEAPECSAAIVAAEVVATLQGHPLSGAPDLLRSPEIFKRLKKDEKLVPLALGALERIKTDSELKDLWEEGDASNEWHNAMTDLERRLSE